MKSELNLNSLLASVSVANNAARTKLYDTENIPVHISRILVVVTSTNIGANNRLEVTFSVKHEEDANYDIVGIVEIQRGSNRRAVDFFEHSFTMSERTGLYLTKTRNPSSGSFDNSVLVSVFGQPLYADPITNIKQAI